MLLNYHNPKDIDVFLLQLQKTSGNKLYQGSLFVQVPLAFPVSKEKEVILGQLGSLVWRASLETLISERKGETANPVDPVFTEDPEK